MIEPRVVPAAVWRGLCIAHRQVYGWVNLAPWREVAEELLARNGFDERRERVH